jgi:hypothetical protein
MPGRVDRSGCFKSLEQKFDLKHFTPFIELDGIQRLLVKTFLELARVTARVHFQTSFLARLQVAY